MAEPFNFELTLTDFLKYLPEAKRHDYELMLRRCNFSDPADPMFPVMLFLQHFLPDIPGFSKSTNHESRHFAFQRDSEDQPLLGYKTAICTERKFLYEST